jgi:hypothetical protein
MKHTLRFVLILFMLVSLVAATVTPVLAEDPPPPPSINPDGSPGKADAKAADASGAVQEDPASTVPSSATGVSQSTAEQSASQPNYNPSGIATSGMGTFQGEQLVNTGGNLVKEGTDLGALSAGWAYYCASGTLPDFMTGGTCHTRDALLQNAINAALPGWTIWTTQYFGDYHLITVNKPLTLQGDPTGLMFVGAGGSSGVTVTSPNVTIRNIYSYGMVSMYNQPGTLRLQNINIDAPAWFALGLEYEYGNVIIGNLSVVSSLYGAYISTTNGPGTVSILNSAFDNSTSGYGLQIYANNKVTLESVSASGNWNDGLYINYQKGLSIKNSKFNDNYNSSHAANPVNDGDAFGYGIYAKDTGVTAGPVLLQNVTAMRNGENGATFEAAGATTILNTFFMKNVQHGLRLIAGRGNVTLDGVIADQNSATSLSFDGAQIDTKGSVSINASSFNQNGDDGNNIYAYGGITVKNSQASYNSYWGMYLFNAYSTTSAGTTLYNNYFTMDGHEGLMVQTRGNVLISGLSVTGSNFNGSTNAVEISNANCVPVAPAVTCTPLGNVTFSNTQGGNMISQNAQSGLRVLTHGSFTATNLVVNDNHSNGALIDTTYGIGNVTISSSFFNQNGRPYGTAWAAYGLTVKSNGNISLDKVTAFYNTTRGIDLDNHTTPLGAKTVSLKNINSTYNWGAGVYIKSKGGVTINHLVSNNNTDYGFYIDNTAGTTAGVTLTNTLGNNIASYNTHTNYIYSRGTVSITGLEVLHSYAGGDGLFIINTLGTGNVYLTNVRINEGALYGVDVYSNGNITATNVEVSGNASDGAVFFNNTAAGKTVTINKGIFSKNGGYGININAGGAVTINGVVASNNGGNGVMIYNKTFGSYNVTLNSTLGANLFSNNGDDGVNITTAGNVTVSKTTANFNVHQGFDIYMYGAGKTVTMTCAATSRNGTGIYVTANAGPVMIYLKGTFPFWNLGTDYGVSSGTFVFTQVNCP